MTSQTFMKKVDGLHTDIDYSHVVYKDYVTPIKLRCIVHDFMYHQAPKKHIQQRGVS